MPNEQKYGIITLSNQTKRDYRVAALVIPTPTPEWPFDGLRTVPRRQA